MPGSTAQSSVPRAHFAPAIAWLRERGVGTLDLAGAFETTPNHIAVLAHRGRSPFDSHSARPAAPRDGSGAPVRRSRVDELERALEAIHVRHRDAHDFDESLFALRQFRPQLGRPTSTEMKRLLARWYFLRAWFAVHGGYTTTALENATASMFEYRFVALESGEQADLKQMADAALIASHCYLYVNEPQMSLKLLRIFREVSARAGNSLGGDYYRQFGTAHVLSARATESDTDYATRVLAQVPEAMQRLHQAQSQLQLEFWTRQYHLQREPADVEACEGLVTIASSYYGADSLEAAIAANYASAAELTTDSTQAHQTAAARLDRSLKDAARFPHQWAVSKLLSLTPRLQLDRRLRGLWVRQVSYLNPLRRY